MNLAGFLESTDLRPTLTDRDIDQLIHDAVSFDLLGVCVPPFWVKRARREIGQQALKLVTVAGFPFGFTLTESRLDEIARAIEHGADEIDLVMNISAFKSGMEWVKVDMARASRLVHDSGKILKIIVETSFLTPEELSKACRQAVDAGADFIKTSTGLHGQGITPATVSYMRSLLPAEVGIKASGGIRTKKLALELIEAGAQRIGTSAAASLLN